MKGLWQALSTGVEVSIGALVALVVLLPAGLVLLAGYLHRRHLHVDNDKLLG